MSHAMLSPSSANRWIHCPPSAKINAEAPQKDTPYTREGTLAHAVCELKARKHFLTGIGPRKFAAAMAKFRADEMWADEMDGYTDEYLEALKDIAATFEEDPYVTLEQRVDFSEWVPEGFGTADCIMIGGRVLHVIDFKYGKGVAVDARNNFQMMLYALGALSIYDTLYDIDIVRMTIVQPRIHTDPETRTWECHATGLRNWARAVAAPAARLAAAGEGEYAEGEWCRWCAIRATCRARASVNMALEDFGGKVPPELSDDEVGRALTVGARLKAWLSDLEEYALAACLDGKEIPGFKAVAGRSVRTWTDQQAAFDAALAAGIPETMLYERKPVTLAALEKIVGKKPFAEALGAFVEIPPGKPTLVKAEDKRPAITNRPSAEDDFSEDIPQF